MKHVGRGLKLHDKLETFYKKEVQKKKEDKRKVDVKVRNMEKEVEEKMKKVKLLEDEVNQLEKEALEVAAVGGARKKERKTNTKPKKEGSQRSSPFLSF